MRSTHAPSRRRRRIWPALAIVLAIVLAIAALLASRAEQIVLGAEAYIFGYPLVIMDVTRASQGATGGQENRLQQVRGFPDARFRGVVRPNVDTLYSNAFIDMAQGPWLFSMASNDQRYQLMSFMDAWTNVFAAPGTRTTGTRASRFLLVGPSWHGKVPADTELLRAPTRMVWLIGRTQARGTQDFALVHRLQDGVTLTRLEARESDTAPDAVQQPADMAPVLPPIEQMRRMPVQVFFDRLAQRMVDNPPHAADGPMLTKLARLGIAPGRAPQWSLPERWAVALGRAIADRTVARELQKRPHRHGWITPPAILGNYGTAYNIRAVVAMIGLGANLPQDAIYPSASIDGDGNPLDGAHRYRLRFDAGAWPPANAFWSVTAYGSDGFLIDNPLARHALGSHDPLVANPDGSLDLLIQADAPAPALRGNWLPVRADAPFQLTMRLYDPRPVALDGSWTPPPVNRVDRIP